MKKYVAVHQITGPRTFVKDKVFSEDELPPGADMVHLRSVGAIREATEQEAATGVVVTEEQATTQLRANQEQLSAMQDKINSLNSELSQAKQLGFQTGLGNDPSGVAKEINRLKVTVNDLSEKCHAKDRENANLRSIIHKLKEGEEVDFDEREYTPPETVVQPHHQEAAKTTKAPATSPPVATNRTRQQQHAETPAQADARGPNDPKPPVAPGGVKEYQPGSQNTGRPKGE